MSNLPATEGPSLKDGLSRAAHPYRAFFIRAGLGLAIVAIILWRFDARPALRALARESGWYFGAALIVYIAGQAMSAYRWELLARVLKLRGPYREFLAYYFVGMFTNLFVPGLLGGDAARAFYLGRRHDRLGEAVAATIADRGYGLLGLFWFEALSAAVVINRGTLPRGVTTPCLAVGAISFAAWLGSPLLARLIHLTPRAVRRGLGVIAPYLHHPVSVLVPIAMSVALQASIAVCQYILARGLGLEAPLLIFMLVVPIAGVFASLPITLNGLGLRETAYLVLFPMAGMGRNDAIALGLLMFATSALAGLLGAIAFVTTEVPPARHHETA